MSIWYLKCVAKDPGTLPRVLGIYYLEYRDIFYISFVGITNAYMNK